MWTAKSHRYAKTLRVADGHIGAEFARSPQQDKRKNVGGNHDNRADTGAEADNRREDAFLYFLSRVGQPARENRRK